MEMKTVAVLQARMGSQRLPGKMLADIAGRPLIWHVVGRARMSRSIDEVVVATTKEPSDDPLVKFCYDHQISCYRGSEADVLDRFYQAAVNHQATLLVRITGDCPLIDSNVIDLIVGKFKTTECDYASNIGYVDTNGHFVGRTFPDGLDVEVFSLQTLHRAWEEAKKPSEREHVTPYIYKNPEKFNICSVTQNIDLSMLRWTVDVAKDLEFVRQIYSHLYKPNRHFTTDDVLKLLQTHPKLSKVNEGFEINEGYRISLEKD